MKVGIICDPVDVGQKTWIPVYCEQLVKELIRDGRKNDYVFFHMKPNPIFEGYDEVILPSTADSFSNALKMVWKKFVRMPYELRKHKVDLVHELNLIWPHIFDFFRPYKAVVTVHDLTPLLFPQYHSFVNVLWFRIFGKLSCLTADRVIANSESTKADVMKYFWVSSEKIDVTYLWTNVLERSEDPSIHFDFPFILSVWTIEPRKNLERVVKAFELLKSNAEYKDLKLVLTWKKGWKVDTFFEKLSLAPDLMRDIVFTGFVTDEQLVHLYKTCSLFVYVSLYEWFWLPVLEAMSLWAKVVTSKVSSLPEVAGGACALADPSSHVSIHDEIVKEIRRTNPRSELWTDRAKNFTWQKCSDWTAASYLRA